MFVASPHALFSAPPCWLSSIMAIRMDSVGGLYLLSGPALMGKWQYVSNFAIACPQGGGGRKDGNDGKSKVSIYTEREEEEAGGCMRLIVVALFRIVHIYEVGCLFSHSWLRLRLRLGISMQMHLVSRMSKALQCII